MTTEFTPLASTAGGLLIGAAAATLYLFQGRIAGISHLLRRLLPPYAGAQPVHAAAFIAGLLAAPLVYTVVSGHGVVQSISGNLPLMALGGLLVGFGATYGGGCTSGHGVCGLARLSPRSLVATITFMATAVLTVYAVRHLGAAPWAF